MKGSQVNSGVGAHGLKFSYETTAPTENGKSQIFNELEQNTESIPQIQKKSVLETKFSTIWKNILNQSKFQ